MYSKRLLALCFALFAGASSAATPPITPAYDKDVEMFAIAFGSPDKEVLEEAVVRLSWAGITDRRIYDPLLQQLAGPKRFTDIGLRRYFEALAASGNPEIYTELEKMSKNLDLKFAVRSGAKDSLKESGRYLKIAEEMNVGLDTAKNNEELWALRHKNGLAVGDPHRVRLAARDLFLHNYGAESLDVAAATLRANVDVDLTDARSVDAMAFLCKALGVSRRREYKETLIYVANNTRTRKLMDYAERSTQYFDSGFKASNKNFKPHK